MMKQSLRSKYVVNRRMVQFVQESAANVFLLRSNSYQCQLPRECKRSKWSGDVMLNRGQNRQVA